MARVRVAATTANLGVGFDCFGCALSLYAKASFEECEQGLEIQGCPDEFVNDENLMVVGYHRVMQELGLSLNGLRIEFSSDIPFERGLGSSAALIVLGVYGANANHGYPLTLEQCFQLACEIEGHPDNVAPAIFGGLCISMQDDDGCFAERVEVHKDLAFTVLIPEFHVSTIQARKVLPEKIAHREAVLTLARSHMLLKGLKEADERLIQLSLRDYLHEPYRMKLIEEFDLVKAIGLKHGAIGMCISGSGPSCLLVSKDFELSKKIADDLKKLKHKWSCIDLKVEENGVKVEG